MKKLFVFLLVSLTLLSGCVPVRFEVSSPDTQVVMPTPADEAPEAPMGDGADSVRFLASLYVPSADGQRLIAREMQIQRPADVSPVEFVLNALLLTLAGDVRSIVPEGTRVLSVEESGDLVTVDLSLDARNTEGDQQATWLRAAIANTLTRLPGVKYVNVLSAGRQEGTFGLPNGASGGMNDDLTALWAQLLTEAELLEETANPMNWELERTVFLYYASPDGELFAPEARTLRFTGEGYAEQLVQELLAASQGSARSPFPSQGDMQSEPALLVDDALGRRIVMFSFEKGIEEALQAEGKSVYQLCGSLTLTLAGFLPGLDGVSIYVDGEALTLLETDSGAIESTDGVWRREDFAGAVCGYQTLYWAGEEGGLKKIVRPVARAQAGSARAALSALMAGPKAWEEGSATLPAGLTEADVLGIRISGGEALVNLSSNFYRCCQSFSALQEQLMVYSMVNALTDLDEVERVRFYVESEPVDTLVTTVFLRGALMRNPGLIRE